MEMLLALGFSPLASLAFVMATGFVADVGSLPLVVSNLVNIVSADFFKISFADYARGTVPVDLVAVLAALGVLYLYYRRVLPEGYPVEKLPRPLEGVRDPVVFRQGFWVLLLLLVGYFVSGPLGVPVSLVAGLGAAWLLLVAARRGRPVGRLFREAPWQVVVFSLGMYLVVFGLKNQGLTAYLGEVLALFKTPLEAALGTAFLSAGLSATMNNMPTVMVVALAIRDSGAHGLVQKP